MLSLFPTKRSVHCLILAGAVGLCGVLPAQAEEPAQVLQKVVTRLKETGDPSTLVEFVDWNTAYAEIGDIEKKEFKIENATDLKAFYTRALADPTTMMREHFQKQMASSTPDQQAQLRQTMKELEQSLKEQMESVKTQIKNTEYTVGKTTPDGATKASVDLTTKFEGEERTDQVELVKVNDHWMLASLDDIDGGDEVPLDEEMIDEGIDEGTDEAEAEVEDEAPMSPVPAPVAAAVPVPPAPAATTASK